MEGLNRAQYKASLPQGGVHMVLAGAGTGKTTVLVHRVKNLLEEGLGKREGILILTFSRKAAQEIRERVFARVPGAKDSVIAGTFHSFCLLSLKEWHKEYLKMYQWEKFPTVLSQEDEERMKDDILKPHMMSLRGIPRDLAAYLISDGRFEKKRLPEELSRILESIGKEFDQARRERGVVSYSDIINHYLHFLDSHKRTALFQRNRFHSVFIDEFQDSSHDNMDVVRTVIRPGDENLFVVGDDRQSIYGWRHADPGIMLSLHKRFKKVEKHILTENYRSHREIVEASERIIRINKNQVNRKLRSAKGKGGLVKQYSVTSFKDELPIIINILASSRGSWAILVRNNWQVKLIEEGLKKKNIHGGNIMTAHRSKGLEFDIVIISGMKDGLFPDKYSNQEEETRLFYVAMTRSRKELHMIFHNDSGTIHPYRVVLGQGKKNLFR